MAAPSYRYSYPVSKAAAIVFMIIFIVLALAHSYSVFRSRKFFGLAIIAGALFEIVGLIARLAYASDYSKATYILQTLLILLAPIMFAAATYMFLGRLIRASNHAQYSLIPLKWLTKIFVSGDILCFVIQGAGAGLLVNASSASEEDKGRDIILGGLGLQIFIFGFYVLVALLFHRRISQELKHINPDLQLNKMLLVLYTASMLVTVRNIYRLIEYESGKEGYLQTHEWPTYGLDIGLMAILTVATSIWYSADLRVDFEAIPLQDQSSR